MNKIVLLVVFAGPICAQGAHSVTLGWTDTVNPSGTTYNVYRATSTCTGSPTFSKIASAVAVKTYVDSAVTVNDYCYQVTAFLNSAESAPSNSVLAAVLPFAPTGLSIVSSPTTAALTWADSQNVGATYNVYRAAGLCSGSPTFSKIASGVSTLAYTDSTVTPGAYCYQVTATLNSLESAPAPSAAASIPPSAPGALTAQVQ